MNTNQNDDTSLSFNAEYRAPLGMEIEIQNNALLVYARWCVKAALSIPTNAGTRNTPDNRSSVFPLTSTTCEATLLTPNDGVLKGVN